MTYTVTVALNTVDRSVPDGVDATQTKINMALMNAQNQVIAQDYARDLDNSQYGVAFAGLADGQYGVVAQAVDANGSPLGTAVTNYFNHSEGRATFKDVVGMSFSFS